MARKEIGDGVSRQDERYRERGGAADLVRVEVLVPRDKRNDIVSAAAGMREDHRKRKDRLAEYLNLAAERYGLRIFDNIDIERLDDVPSWSRVVANALIEEATPEPLRWDGRCCPYLTVVTNGSDRSSTEYHGIHHQKPLREQLYGGRCGSQHELAACVG
ncbi:hypothetical protein [Ensifer sp. 4252]|uniref:hypothetical protein n=1 Tax=Ensifer sp. 4252 TaxID=3373915 RepID=UPI003D191A7F